MDEKPIYGNNNIKTWWIINEYNEEFGWINERDNKIISGNFLGRDLNPIKVVNDPEIQRLCPDLVNFMYIYLVHHG